MTNIPNPPDAAAVPAPARRQSTNGLAVAAMVVSLVGALPFTFYGLEIYMNTWAIVPALILSMTGVVLGAVALRQLRDSSQRGRWMALTGIIVSSICLVGGGLRDILAFANDNGQLMWQLRHLRQEPLP
jgi:drug/metabolite transporter (DMT)-like permease